MQIDSSLEPYRGKHPTKRKRGSGSDARYIDTSSIPQDYHAQARGEVVGWEISLDVLCQFGGDDSRPILQMLPRSEWYLRRKCPKGISVVSEVEA